MARGREFRFRIERYAPETIPMGRLAEYMVELAALLGHAERVHFVRVDPGSLDIVHEVDEDIAPEVSDRVVAAREGRGPQDAMEAYRNINRRLAADDSRAFFRSGEGAEIIEFPGVEVGYVPTEDQVVEEYGALEGVLMRIGGFQEDQPIGLKWGDTRYTHVYVSPDLIPSLRAYVHQFDRPIRVYGVGRWRRSQDGSWSLDHFAVSNFEVIEGDTLKSVAAQLRAIPGAGWEDEKDPIGDLLRERHEDDEAD